MSKRIVFWVLALSLVGGFGAAVANDTAGSWTGVITDDHCGAKENHSAACVTKCVKDHGAKYGLVVDKKVYILDPQTDAAAHANESVKVTGTMDGSTIKVTKIEAAPPAK